MQVAAAGAIPLGLGTVDSARQWRDLEVVFGVFFTSFEVFPKSYHVFPVVFLRTSGLLVPLLGTEVTQKLSLNFKTWLGGLQF